MLGQLGKARACLRSEAGTALAHHESHTQRCLCHVAAAAGAGKVVTQKPVTPLYGSWLELIVQHLSQGLPGQVNVEALVLTLTIACLVLRRGVDGATVGPEDSPVREVGMVLGR